MARGRETKRVYMLQREKKSEARSELRHNVCQREREIGLYKGLEVREISL